MPNQDIGECECPLCNSPAHVRGYKSDKGNKGKLYVHCANCGPIMSTAKGAQDAIQKRAKLFSSVASAPPTIEPEKKRAPVRTAPTVKREAPEVATALRARPNTFELDD